MRNRVFRVYRKQFENRAYIIVKWCRCQLKIIKKHLNFLKQHFLISFRRLQSFTIYLEFLLKFDDLSELARLNLGTKLLCIEHTSLKILAMPLKISESSYFLLALKFRHE